MERDELALLFYGEGEVPAPWATDCPVRFDVWAALARSEPGGQKHQVDVILAVNEEHGVRRVLDRLRAEAVQPLNPVAAGSFVVARLSLDALVRVVLPLTNLYGLVKLAKNQPLQQLVDMTSSDVLPPLVSDPKENEERHQERRGHLAWLLRLLREVARAETPDVSNAVAGFPDPAQSVARMLHDAGLDPEATQLPGVSVSRVIDRRRRFPVVSVTTNRSASPAVTRSRETIKSDAAESLFSVDCSGIGWAVLDSGIDALHPAFSDWDTSVLPSQSQGSRILRIFNFVNARNRLAEGVLPDGLIDWVHALPHLEMSLPQQSVDQGLLLSGVPPAHAYQAPGDAHGTHVAGILGAFWPHRQFRGICPTIRLYDFRVLDSSGQGDEFSIVAALQAVRHINEQAGRLVIAGVNLSLAVPHDVATHACGWTPVCIECDRLVRSGVIVVAAAGNSGYSGATRTLGSDFRPISVSDPGNADLVITVGSTHRSNPHRHGVSYFSGRGPTADGRLKPDLLAPGEDIDGPVPGEGVAAMHGTSQAAAHVSGAAAMLTSRYRELLGRPDRVKALLCSTATDLAREQDFQGHGLVDVLRAMQAL